VSAIRNLTRASIDHMLVYLTCINVIFFRWGRWNDILTTGQFRTGWRESDVEDCARVIVLYCLRCFRGDEKLKQFGWDMVTPPEFVTEKLSSKQIS
jgi:hypothetical protein